MKFQEKKHNLKKGDPIVTEKTYTQKELERMPDHDLDATVFETLYKRSPVWSIRDKDYFYDEEMADPIPHYSTDANEALKIMNLNGINFDLIHNGGDQWIARILHKKRTYIKGTFEKTICIAAILEDQENMK